MYYVKRAIYGPDLAEQRRKCQSLIRKNQREIDRQIASLSQVEAKSKTMIKQAAKRNDLKSARMLAKEVHNVQKQKSRMQKSKAQLNSIGLQVNEAFAIQKLQGTMKSSAGVMKEVNSLVKMPALTGTMAALGSELMKAGIIEEMVTDALDSMDTVDALDSEGEEEIDRILEEITGQKQKIGAQLDELRPTPADQPAVPASEPEKEQDDDEEVLNKMRDRLKALQAS